MLTEHTQIYFSLIPNLFSAVLIVQNDQILKQKDIELGFEVWQVCCEIYIYYFNFCIDHYNYTVDPLEIPFLLCCTSCNSSFPFFMACRAILMIAFHRV